MTSIMQREIETGDETGVSSEFFKASNPRHPHSTLGKPSNQTWEHIWPSGPFFTFFYLSCSGQPRPPRNGAKYEWLFEKSSGKTFCTLKTSGEEEERWMKKKRGRESGWEIKALTQFNCLNRRGSDVEWIWRTVSEDFALVCPRKDEWKEWDFLLQNVSMDFSATVVYFSSDIHCISLHSLGMKDSCMSLSLTKTLRLPQNEG